MSELSDLLQSAIDVDECMDVLRGGLPDVFAGTSGMLYLREPETGIQTKAVDWGATTGPWRQSEPSLCWAVRRGADHLVRSDGSLRCRHLQGVEGSSRCVPMMAHGQLVGLLIFIADDTWDEASLEAVGDFTNSVADQIALAIANVRLRERLRHQSLRDQLTGLYNRRFFDDWLAKQLCQVRRNAGTLGVALIDIDHFKRFNDTHGHLIADRMLVGLSRLLEKTVRSEDVVCRWGGEEFVIAMPGADEGAVKQVVGRIQDALCQLEILDDEGIRVSPSTISAGVACFPRSAVQQEPLLRRADQALYRAKSGGRNLVVIAAPTTADDGLEIAEQKSIDVEAAANQPPLAGGAPGTGTEGR